MLVNGIPVATAELKNKLTKQTVKDAKKQYRTDRDPAEPIFARRPSWRTSPWTPTRSTWPPSSAGRTPAFCRSIEGHDGGKGNPPGTPGPYATSYLWEEVWQRDNWLDILRRFVHVSKDGGAEIIIFPRYHQWDAVLRLLATRRPTAPGTELPHRALGRLGQEQHHRLARAPARGLARRRRARLRQGHHRHRPRRARPAAGRHRLPVRAPDAAWSRRRGQAVAPARRGADVARRSRIVISTLQKFPFVLDKLKELPDTNYAVIVDEAHSSQGGEAAKALSRRSALPPRTRWTPTTRRGRRGGVRGGDAGPARRLGQGARQAAQPLLLRVHRHADTAHAGAVRHRHRRMASADRSTCTRCARPSRRASSSTCSSTTRRTASCGRSRPERRRQGGRQEQGDPGHRPLRHPASEDAGGEGPHHRRALPERVASKVGGKAKAMVVTPSRAQAVRTYFAIKKAAAALGYRRLHGR